MSIANINIATAGRVALFYSWNVTLCTACDLSVQNLKHHESTVGRPHGTKKKKSRNDAANNKKITKTAVIAYTNPLDPQGPRELSSLNTSESWRFAVRAPTLIITHKSLPEKR